MVIIRKKKSKKGKKMRARLYYPGFRKTVQREGAHKMTSREITSNVYEKDLVQKRPPKNIYNLPSAQYLFSVHNHSVKSVTTQVEELKKKNTDDSGWVHLLDKNGKTIFSIQLFRNKYFYNNMADVTVGFIRLLKALPCCADPTCRERMVIMAPDNNNLAELPTVVCPNNAPHDKKEAVSILDFITHRGAHTFLSMRRNRRRWLAEQGRPVGVAKAKRKKSWEKLKP